MLTLDEFKLKLKDNSIQDTDFVQRYITFGNPYVFSSNEDNYFDLKKIIANKFVLGPESIYMVGSAKLGFSIAPHKLWKLFGDDSDIDMVVISENVFDKLWKELYEFNIELTDRTDHENKIYYKFLNYFFKGWLRPDLFPFNFKGKAEWEDFFKSISYNKYGFRKITCAVYRNAYFFENYHLNNIKKLRIGD
jgi:predicted nucleotidyltransferase